MQRVFIYICFFQTHKRSVKKATIILVILFLVGCKRSTNNYPTSTNDSINYYLKYSNKQNGTPVFKKKYNYKAFIIASELNNSAFKRSALNDVVLNSFYINDSETYDTASRLLLTQATKADDTLFMAKAHRYIGAMMYNKLILDSAYYHFAKAEKYYLYKKETQDYAVTLLKKSYIQVDIYDYFGADVSLIKAYYILKNSTNKKSYYDVLNSLGIVAQNLKEYDKALGYYNESLDVIQQADFENKSNLLAIYYNNIGLLYNEKKEFKKAIPFFEKAFQIKDLKDIDKKVYANLLDNYAYSKIRLNERERVLDLLNKALKIREDIDEGISAKDTYINFKEYYLATGDTTRAIEYSQKALQMAKNSKQPHLILNTLQHIIEVDKKNAPIYSVEFIKLSDSLQVVERKNKDRFDRIQLETDQIIQEKNFLEESLSIVGKYLVAAIILSSVVLLYVRLRNRNRELKLKEEAQIANEKLYKLIVTQQDEINFARSNERTRIAREIHDGVLGRLFGLRISLDSIKLRNDDEAVQNRLDYFDELKKVEQHLREISHELSKENAQIIKNYFSLINKLLEDQQKINPAKLHINIQEDIDWDSFDSLNKINLFRILQESLQNINKYAKAKNVKINFYKNENDIITLEVIDDGIGFDLSKKIDGIGMQNLKSRAEESNGTFQIYSQKGTGTHIVVNIPFNSIVQ